MMQSKALAPSTNARFRRSQRGVALATAMMFMLLLTIVGLAMTLTANSDMILNRYYQNFRASFYAADAGLAIGRQQLVNGILAKRVDTFDPTQKQLPIPQGA